MKILILTSRFPYPLEKGDKLRIFHMIRKLSARHQIILCSLSEEDIPVGDFAELEKYCDSIFVFKLHFWRQVKNLLLHGLKGLPLQVAYFYDPTHRKNLDWIIENEKPDLLFCQLIRTTEYLKDVPGRKVLDYMDAFSMNTMRRALKSIWPVSSFLKMESIRVKKYEQEIHKNFDEHFIISRQDEELMALEGHEKLTHIPNGVDSDFFMPQDESSKKSDVAFIGNMGYYPNVKAAVFLAKKVMPILWKRMPQAKLLIAGARPNRNVRNLAGERVEVTGWMEDIREAYASAKVFAAPLFLGAGLQNKILEAMCMGIPCVSSELVNNAIQAEPGESILLAETAEDFANQILDLLGKPERAKAIALNARRFVVNNYSWEEVVIRMEKTISTHESEIEFHQRSH